MRELSYALTWFLLGASPSSRILLFYFWGCYTPQGHALGWPPAGLHGRLEGMGRKHPQHFAVQNEVSRLQRFFAVAFSTVEPNLLAAQHQHGFPLLEHGMKVESWPK